MPGSITGGRFAPPGRPSAKIALWLKAAHSAFSSVEEISGCQLTSTGKEMIRSGMAARPDPSLWDIADLAKEAGVSSRTIRYYGELGLIHAHKRGPNGRRIFDQTALERLRFIARLKNIGLSLELIGKLNQTFDRDQTPGMLQRLDQILAARIEETAVRLKDLAQLEEDLHSYRERIKKKLSDY
mgnify:CR=1 FL=1